MTMNFDSPSLESLRQAGASFPLAYTGLTVADGGAQLQVEATGERVAQVTLVLEFPAEGWCQRAQAELSAWLSQRCPEWECSVTVSWRVSSHAVQGTLKPFPGISNIVAVASGKGGVGKSTVAVNLSLALAADGARVGILDADIYGPSQPRMLGLTGARPETEDGKTIEPLVSHGLKAMSIGFLVDEAEPMIWRGPMVTSALNQLLGQTLWGELDYLIVDMPPGTGDIQLTLSQQVPVSGVVIVTTPQDIALADAAKGLAMFTKVNVPVLGVIENMSLHVCSECGHAEPIFGEAGGARLAEQHQVKLLGSIPLDRQIREQTDSGKPTVVADPDGPLAAVYLELARHTAGQLALRAKDYSHRFPKITIEEA
jgi:ATP-binding protein involved in chromosome partitioning